MPYRGGSLVDFVKAAQGAPLDHAMRKATSDVVGAWAHHAAEHTPKKTGRLAERWEATETIRTPLGFEATIRNPDHRARWVEHGTAPHDIAPKPDPDGDEHEALDTPAGPRESVHHPGARAFHPLALSAQEIEAEVHRIGEPAARQWAAEAEQIAKRHKGIS